jgi:hypothetical protein
MLYARGVGRRMARHTQPTIDEHVVTGHQYRFRFESNQLGAFGVRWSTRRIARSHSHS